MANDFTDDPNCVALWRFESGAVPFLADSIGTNEPLVDYGTVAEDTVNYKEGACSADFGGSQSFHIDDADLDAGFPIKNGDTNKKVSVCGWYRPDVITGDSRGVFAKGDFGAGTMSFRAMYLTAAGAFDALEGERARVHVPRYKQVMAPCCLGRYRRIEGRQLHGRLDEQHQRRRWSGRHRMRRFVRGCRLPLQVQWPDRRDSRIQRHTVGRRNRHDPPRHLFMGGGARQ